MIGEALRKSCSDLAGSNWWIQATQGERGSFILTPDRIQIVLLWEALQEMKRLNTLLHCSNFTNIPRDLRAIKRELASLRKIAGGK